MWPCGRRVRPIDGPCDFSLLGVRVGSSGRGGSRRFSCSWLLLVQERNYTGRVVMARTAHGAALRGGGSCSGAGLRMRRPAAMTVTPLFLPWSRARPRGGVSRIALSAEVILLLIWPLAVRGIPSANSSACWSWCAFLKHSSFSDMHVRMSPMFVWLMATLKI